MLALVLLSCLLLLVVVGATALVHVVHMRPAQLPAPTDVALGPVVVPIAGFGEQERYEHLADLSVGDALSLVREPARPHGIGLVTAAGAHLGFVPDPVARTLAPRLDAGQRARAEIVRIDEPPKSLDECVFVQLSLDG
jgi:hypothetical protein